MILSAESNNVQSINTGHQPQLYGVLQQEISHGIRGWVLDKNNLADSLTVTICFDGKYQFHVPANQMRQNLCDGVSGKYGFDLKLIDLPPEIFESPINQIRASVVQHKYELSQSPMPFDAKRIAKELAGLCEQDMTRLIEKKNVNWNV